MVSRSGAVTKRDFSTDPGSWVPPELDVSGLRYEFIEDGKLADVLVPLTQYVDEHWSRRYGEMIQRNAVGRYTGVNYQVAPHDLSGRCPEGGMKDLVAEMRRLLEETNAEFAAVDLPKFRESLDEQARAKDDAARVRDRFDDEARELRGG